MFIAPIILLILLNLVVGLSPINSENEVKRSIAEHTSANFLDILDRNFTERYGDVLSFSQNSHTVKEVSQRQYSPELVSHINQLIQNYPVYDLMIVVDLKGQVIACNSVDNDGKQVNSSFIYAKNFTTLHIDWFENIVNNKYDGVWYSDIKLNPYAKKIYNKEGLGMGFASAIKNSKGEIIGVWYNLASWEKITQNTSKEILTSLSKAYKGSEIILTNNENKIIEATRPNLIFKNLDFKTNNANAFEISVFGKKEYNGDRFVCGNALEKGVTLYKGQNWKCFTIIPKSKIHFELFLTPTLIVVDIIAFLFTAFIALLLSKSLTERVQNVKEVIEKLSVGDSENIELRIDGKDEIKDIANAVVLLSKNLNLTSQYADEIGKSNFKTHFAPLSNKDKLGKALISMADNLYVSEAKLKDEKTKAEHASMVKSQFLSTMSHELRTPLNAVIGMTNVLIEESPRPDQIENLNIMKFSANNLLAIISDILDFNKMDAGKIQLEDIPFNLKSLIKNIYLSQLPKTKEKNIDFRLNFENTPDNLLIIGDPVRIGQVVNNFLSNAIKFTEKGAVFINILVVEQLEETCKIKFSISDTGIGIPQDKVAHIFDDFTQADADTTRRFGGTGLGLAITKGILELYGSEINVKSEVGVGSEFSFEINLKYNKASEKRKFGVNKLPEKELDLTKLYGKKILLVDDNKINLTVAKKVLAKANLDIITAENGKEAFEIFLNTDPFDLILMDLQMPIMDGYQATIEIRKVNSILPIIALTGEAMFDVEQKVKGAGMNDYITKPYNPDTLFAKLLKYIP